jgi:hypothetical protein
MDGYYASGSDFVHNYVLEMKNPNFSSILDGDLNLLSFFLSFLSWYICNYSTNCICIYIYLVPLQIYWGDVGNFYKMV